MTRFKNHNILEGLYLRIMPIANNASYIYDAQIHALYYPRSRIQR
jgi:hypothetical protein